MNRAVNLTRISLVALVLLMATLLTGIPVFPAAAAFTIEPGNTLVYEVTVFNVPFDQLSQDPNYEGLAAFKGVDLIGSHLYVKILRTNPVQRWYTVAFGGILGKTNTINLTALMEQPANMSGDTIAYGLDLSNMLIQAGSGGRLTAPELQMWAYFDPPDKGGVFYLDQDQWAAHKSELENYYGSNVTVTDGTDEFIAKFGNNTNYVELTWFKTGDNPGILKSFKVQWDIRLSDGSTVTASIVISFSELLTRNLPNISTVTMNLEEGNLDYSSTGNFSDPNDFDTSNLADLKGNLSLWVGRDILRYDIGSKDGLFYSVIFYGPVNISDPDAGLTQLGDVVYNGFDGQIYEKNSYNQLYHPIGATGMMPDILSNALAPLLTPDWELREAESVTANSMLKTIQTIVTSQQYKDEFLSGPGITINSLNLGVQYLESNDHVYQSVEEQIDFSIDGNKYFFNTTNGDVSSGHGSLSVSISLQSWNAYTKAGELAAAALKLNVTINANNFGHDGTSIYPKQNLDGQFDMELSMKIRNSNIASVPSPEEVQQSQGTSTSSGGQNLITPGFEFSTLLILLILPSAILISYQRRRKTSLGK